MTYDYWNLIARAKEYRDATNGAFDITIAPIMDAWGFTGDQFRVPEQSELNELLKHVNSDEIQVQEEPSYSVTLGEGQAIDLGGIAKGYTSDWVEQTFRANGIESGKISLGGNVFVLGGKPDGSDWRVGIKDPRNESGLAAILSLRDAYAITSGGYQRNFTAPDGTVYQHILNPKTGCPVQSDLLSVTIVSDSGTLADACSTALYVMGEQEAVNFWRQTGGFEMVLITADGRLLYTPGLAEKITTPEEGRYAAAAIDA